MVSTVVAVPYPGRGHVNSMMNLCKLLLAVAADHDLIITVVVTEEWLGFLQSEDSPPTAIQFAAIPNVVPSETDRTANIVTFLEAVQTKMEKPFEALLDRLGSPAPVSLIIADAFLNWPVEFGSRRNIPVALLWPMAASVLSVFYHFDLLVRNRHYPFGVSERGNERLDYIPGIESIRLADVPSLAQMEDPRLLNLVLRIFPNVSKAKYMLINSIYAIESGALDALKQEFTFPIYTVGPSIPYSDHHKCSSSPTIDTWLNSQPPDSVLYISFGSYLSVSGAQADEIANGLRQSGVPFLWSAREEAARLEQTCGGGAGKVVRWCDQLRVLSHAAVGGFWTHCGWNSTLEGIHAGVPFIAFPMVNDQTTVRKLIVEDWKVGWDAWEEMGDGKLLRSFEICRLVKKLMDLQCGERKEMMGRVAELQKACRVAVADGGSSKGSLSSFLDDFTREG